MNNIETFEELLETAQDKKRIYQVLEELESAMLEKSISNLRAILDSHLNDMSAAIASGFSASELSISGMSGTDSKKIYDRYHNNSLLPCNKLFGKVLSYSIAVMEENQRMGKVVACPTAGSCGIVPAVIIAYAEEFDIKRDKQIDALFTAGGIGKIVAQKMPLAGAVAGCQAECGVASAMAAAAIVEMIGGTNSQIINAAALAMKNQMGLACDPVAGLVEVPCIKRNAFCAVHGMVASELALSGVESFIPIDEVVQAMIQVGSLMSPMLKECSEAGLATTPTGLNVTKNLEKIWNAGNIQA